MSKQTGMGSRRSQVGCNGHNPFSGPCEVLMSGIARPKQVEESAAEVSVPACTGASTVAQLAMD